MSDLTNHPVIAIGIDVAAPDLVDRYCAEGHLPNLDRLRRLGAWARLRSVTELSSGLTWPTFFTGVNPGKHGQFFTHMQLTSGTYQIHKKYADDVKREPFWMELHRAGKRVAIIDVPQSYPCPGLNGVQVAGWGAEYPAWKRSTWPPELLQDIVRRFGSHPLADEYRLSISPQTKPDYDHVTKSLLHGADRKGELSLHLLRDQPFDLFLTIFPETHWAMHMLWQLLDPEHPAHDPDTVGEFKNFFRDLFAKIDARIGELIACRPESNVLVFSLSGMGPNLACWHLLPEVLQRLHVTAPAAARSGGPLGAMLPMRRWGAAKIRKMEDTVSLGAIRTAKRIAPRRLWDRWTRRILHAGNNWSRSRAFCVPNDYSGAIRINLRGREPRGLVQPGAEYDALCTELREALLELEDVETGRPVVKDVLRTREICHGQYVDELPDLIVLWASERAVQGVRSDRVGTVQGTFPERRSGAHRPFGFLIASGPRIRQAVTIEDVHTLDLAPTILALCGQSVPDDLDGKVLSEMLL